MRSVIFFLSGLLLLFSCGSSDSASSQPEESFLDSVDAPVRGTYGYDFHFLKKHETGIVELKSPDRKSSVLVSPKYQGRVMTSTALGADGASFGWINHELIGTGIFKSQFNPVGGEERFWLGPEGGPFALYFKKGDPFDIAHWQVPAILDTIAYNVIKVADDKVDMAQNGSITNYHGFRFDFQIERSVQLMSRSAIQQRLHIEIPAAINLVGYETVNSIRNAGDKQWLKESGLMSIWLLGMFPPSDSSTVIIPYNSVNGTKQGITDNYFGKIPEGRLRVEDNLIYLNCDGKWRSKIGLSPAIAQNIAAAVDLKNNILHVVYLNVDRHGAYVNSLWEDQKNPYGGDVINAYNDGPLADGKQLGPFFEIESSSAAKELMPGEKQEYRQMTCHFQGSYAEIKKLAEDILGVDIGKLKK